MFPLFRSYNFRAKFLPVIWMVSVIHLCWRSPIKLICSTLVCVGNIAVPWLRILFDSQKLAALSSMSEDQLFRIVIFF